MIPRLGAVAGGDALLDLLEEAGEDRLTGSLVVEGVAELFFARAVPDLRHG